MTIMSQRQSIERSNAKARAAAVVDTLAGHLTAETQARSVGEGQGQRQSKTVATSRGSTAAVDTPAGQYLYGAHQGVVGGGQDQRQSKQHASAITHPAAAVDSPSVGQSPAETQATNVDGGLDTDQAMDNTTANNGSPGRVNAQRPTGHAVTKVEAAAAPNSLPANRSANAKGQSSAGIIDTDQAMPGSRTRDTAPGRVNAQQPTGHAVTKVEAAAAPNSLPAKPGAKTRGKSSVGIVEQQQAQAACDHQRPVGPLLFDPALFVLGANVDDLERTRIAAENRIRALTTGTISGAPSKDGIDRGHGLTPEHPAIGALLQSLHSLEDNEKRAVKALEKQMRQHPLWAWAKDQKGVGEKTLARLLQCVGDPYWRDEVLNEDGSVRWPEGPRTLAQLRAYIGWHVHELPADHIRDDPHTTLVGGGHTTRGNHRAGVPADQSSRGSQGPSVGGDVRSDTGQIISESQPWPVGVAPRRRKGQQANWNDEGRKRLWLICSKTVMQLRKPCTSTSGVHPNGIPYTAEHVDACECGQLRRTYDEAKAKYADAVHRAPCAQCGKRGSPAPVDSPLSDGHKHARALRIVGREILAGLYETARQFYDAQNEQLAKSA
jgi:hypothetical protein